MIKCVEIRKCYSTSRAVCCSIVLRFSLYLNRLPGFNTKRKRDFRGYHKFSTEFYWKNFANFCKMAGNDETNGHTEAATDLEKRKRRLSSKLK